MVHKFIFLVCIPENMGERFDFGNIVKYDEVSRLLQRLSNNSGLEVVLEKGWRSTYAPHKKIETHPYNYKGYFARRVHIDESLKIDFNLPLFGGAKQRDPPGFQFFFLENMTIQLNTYEPVEAQMKRAGEYYAKLHTELNKYFSEHLAQIQSKTKHK